MPVKQRVAKERRPFFDAETLRLFLKLETTPPRRRRARWFQEAERDLHRRLGLGAEWLCSGTSATVLDRRDEPLYMDPDRPIYRDWQTVHRVRLDLLAAAAETQRRQP